MPKNLCYNTKVMNDDMQRHDIKSEKHCKKQAKLLNLFSPAIDTNCAKNEAEHLLRKRRKKVKNAIIFGVFCALVFAVYIAAFIIDALVSDSFWIARFARESIINNNGHPIIQTIVTCALGYLIITATHFFIKLLARGANKRRKTLVTLAASLVKYVGYIIVLVIIFNVWELDTAILAAVIAALGIALGFGAQGLVSDLLTGVFLIFENSLQVGDIISYNDYRGEVEEIGIRTSKIRHVNGNVKVFNNSELKVFVNMSMHRSVVVCDVTIEYGENIERVEKIIMDYIPQIAEKYEIISDGPHYKGLAEFNEKGVVLRIIAKCHEVERLQLERDLNREFKLLFDKHNIRLAVPKIELVGGYQNNAVNIQ